MQPAQLFPALVKRRGGKEDTNAACLPCSQVMLNCSVCLWGCPGAWKSQPRVFCFVQLQVSHFVLCAAPPSAGQEARATWARCWVTTEMSNCSAPWKIWLFYLVEVSRAVVAAAVCKSRSRDHAGCPQCTWVLSQTTPRLQYLHAP